MGFRIPGQSTKSQQLQGLAEAFPSQNQGIATGMQEAQKLQVQNTLGASARGGQPVGNRAIQAAGAQQATAQAAPVLQANQQNIAQQGQIAQMGLQQKKQEAQQALSSRQLGLQKKARELQGKLSTLGNNLEDTLIKQQMDFKKDEMGRTFFNERQLADWAIMKAKTDEDFRNYEQKVTQASKKKMQILKTAYAKIKQILEQGYTDREQTLDNNQRRKATLAKAKLEQKIAEEKAEAENRAAMFSAGGAILGGVVGAAIGGPAGASAGMSAGQGLGSVTAGATA